MTRFRVAPDIESDVLAGVAWASGLNASEDNPHWSEMEELAAILLRVHTGKSPGDIAALQPARSLYRRFGMDPTRTRPSSEALLRRVLKGQDLYHINRLVDAANWASLAILLPIGLYDLDRVEGDIVLRVGAEGESYPGIRKGDVNLAGRLTVADDRGPFGSPTSDSARTSVRADTTRALAVVFAPGDFPRLEMEEGLGRLMGQMLRWCGGEDDGSWILGGQA